MAASASSTPSTDVILTQFYIPPGRVPQDLHDATAAMWEAAFGACLEPDHAVNAENEEHAACAAAEGGAGASARATHAAEGGNAPDGMVDRADLLDIALINWLVRVKGMVAVSMPVTGVPASLRIMMVLKPRRGQVCKIGSGLVEAHWEVPEGVQARMKRLGHHGPVYNWLKAAVHAAVGDRLREMIVYKHVLKPSRV